ncbi:MAG: bifunctional homocysteine S-methyltransferase/methylenetetrahydrofolate reductase [Sedimentisphaerales bacterium]|nr:bifunctional homocysteine S-methyltransferase/methylenetetrahydrofolate reductase [Sedimentisphaerales bacterium]
MSTNGLIELLEKRVVIGDGAMGTMLYEKGVFLNSCFEELNLSKRQLIRQIHSEYIDAGVDFIETNTFGANAFKLAKFGLAERVEHINTAAVEIAKESAEGSVMVAGSMGPLGREVGPYSLTASEEAAKAFREQARILTRAGVDFLLLETFSSSQELIIAIDAAADVSDVPIVAHLTIDENHQTLYGERIEHVFPDIAGRDKVVAVGLNCCVGPAQMLSALNVIKGITNKPISIMPNAGLPRRMEDRTLYMCTPEYMAEYAKRFFENGARIIGGCCGTTPKHIKQIAKAITAMSKSIHPKKKKESVIEIGGKKQTLTSPKRLAEKSTFGAKLCSGHKVTTIEITPPLGTNVEGIIEKAKFCAQHGIDAINIPDGPRASSRLSPMVTALQIQQQANIETILHYCCRDRNLIAMQSDLLGASVIGLKNILIITGDPPKLGAYPDSTGVFDLDSIALTEVAAKLNRGLDIGGNTFSPTADLAIAVGANPVAENIEREIERFKQKVEAGAEFAITQPVFDEKMLFDFLDSVKEFRIPIIAGIWPFTSYKNAEFMANEVPGVVVPKKWLEKMKKTTTKEQGRAAGIEIAKEMIETIKDRVEGFAVSAPFGNVKIALATLGKVPIDET